MPEDDTASLSTNGPLLADSLADQAAEYSFTGRPLRVPKGTARDTKANSALFDMALGGDAGFAAGAAGAAGANLAPPRFDGGRLVSVPVKLADLGGEEGSGMQADARGRRGFFGRKRKDDKGFVMVQMSSAEYRAHWAKGEDGKWLEGVTDPPEGRAEWVKQRTEGK